MKGKEKRCVIKREIGIEIEEYLTLHTYSIIPEYDIILSKNSSEYKNETRNDPDRN
jgi:hypothetical protein